MNRLRLETTDRLPFWIVGDPAKNERTELSQTLGAQMQITRNTQLVSGAEWDVVQAYDRKNNKVVFTAEANRKFASAEARMAFLQTLAPVAADEALHLWEGTVWLRMSKPDASFIEWPVPSAVITLAGTRLDGAVGLMITYQIVAGGISSATRTGYEGIFLQASGIPGDVCELILYGTTSGGSFDNADSVFSGSPPATLTAGTTLELEIGDNNSGLTNLTFEVVAPGGSASGGNIAIETPFIDNLDVISAYLQNYANVRSFSGVISGRKFLYLGWSAAPITTAAEVVIRYTITGPSIFYGAGSTGAGFNSEPVPGITLADAEGVYLIADGTPAA